jgi:hypothetical protein
MAAGPPMSTAGDAAPGHVVIAIQEANSRAQASHSSQGQDWQQDHQQQHQGQADIQPEAQIQCSFVHLPPLAETPAAIARWGSNTLQECRICLSADHQDDLVQPCSCDGTVKHAHLECLRAWVRERQQLECELCGKPYKPSIRQHLTPLIDSSSRHLSRRLDNTVTGTSGGHSQAAAADREAYAPAVVSWTRFWIHIAVLVMLLVAVLYLALFVPVNTSDNFWLTFLWRVSHAAALLCSITAATSGFSHHHLVGCCSSLGPDKPACPVRQRCVAVP